MLKKETLKYEEVEELLGPPPHGKKKLIEFEEFENTVSQAGQGETSENKKEQELEQESQRANSKS